MTRPTLKTVFTAVGTVVVALIASSALATTWTIPAGSVTLAWPNRLRHVLFVALALILVVRRLIDGEQRTPGVPIDHPVDDATAMRPWLMGLVTVLLVGVSSLDASQTTYMENYQLHTWVTRRLARCLGTSSCRTTRGAMAISVP